MKKIYIVILVSLGMIFYGCNSKENNNLNIEITKLNNKIASLEQENNNLNTTVSTLEEKITELETKNNINTEKSSNDFNGTALFDLIGINYNISGESIYSTGELYLIFKNYKNELGNHIFKILDSSMCITNIEQLSDSNYLFKVNTFLPGGGTYYKFAFEDGSLLKYVMDLPEGNIENSPEYHFVEKYEFKDIFKMKLEECYIYK